MRARRGTHRSTHRCCDAKRTRAHGTVDAERGAGRRCMFAERQILDVLGSGVLDACKQRLQPLSVRADVSVERADFETAPPPPLRHLALALESTLSSRTRSDSNGAADDAARIESSWSRRNA
jgi:hypothetical protein